MTRADGFEQQLQSWLHEEGAAAQPLDLHDRAIDRARGARQRSGWMVAIRRGTPGTPMVAGGLRVAILWVLIGIVIAVAVFGGAVAGGVIKLQATIPVATESPTPSAEPSPSLIPAQQYVEDGLKSGMTTASREFGLPLTFKLLSEQGDRSAVGAPTWWCLDGSTRTSSRLIALYYLKGCVSEVRFIRPYAVDCGTPDEHPNAATLAAAILAKPNVASDLGAIAEASALPEGMFLESDQGRVIQTGTGRAFAPDAVNPDQCRLLPDPTGHDPTIEIRGDMPSTLILMDVRGELVVLRFAGGGYDGPSGATANERGYLAQVPTHIYAEIYDISWN